MNAGSGIRSGVTVPIAIVNLQKEREKSSKNSSTLLQSSRVPYSPSQAPAKPMPSEFKNGRVSAPVEPT